MSQPGNNPKLPADQDFLGLIEHALTLFGPTLRVHVDTAGARGVLTFPPNPNWKPRFNPPLRSTPQ